MNIYIGNLSLGITEEDLRKEFSRFGQVAAVTMMNDQHFGNGQATGYGYVEMPSNNEGCSAIAGMHGKILHGREITAIEAMPLSHDTPKGQYNREVRQGRWGKRSATA
ncbi:RNA-binding protein [Dehalogenimonas sp. THU2]|uniref:RNA recognition motif domain-containing protein n=1 Tax=Dehalogenimonas sp. THU2 TaxID=3151121 RepID=UPI0032181398